MINGLIHANTEDASGHGMVMGFRMKFVIMRCGIDLAKKKCVARQANVCLSIRAIMNIIYDGSYVSNSTNCYTIDFEEKVAKKFVILETLIDERSGKYLLDLETPMPS